MSTDIIARGLAAAQARSANTQALARAVRSNSFFPQPLYRCPANDLATVTVPAAGAVSAITGGAATSANVPVTNTAKITWLCGSADKDVNVTFSARGAWYAGARANNYTSYEFLHTGTQFEVQVLCSGLAIPNPNFRVLVNDRIAGTGFVPADGGNRLIRVQFPVSGTRRVRIELCGGRHRGINVASPSEISGTGRLYPTVTVIGDSFPEATGATAYDGEGISTIRAIGCNPALAAVGGTGILNPATGGKVNWQNQNRLDDLALTNWTDQITNAAPAAPAMGVIMMSINDQQMADANWGGAANYQDAIAKGLWVLVDYWLAQRPGKPLVVFGPTNPNSTILLDLYRMRDAGQEVCAAAGPNVYFRDRLAPVPVLRTGSISRTSATGTLTSGSKIITGLTSTAGVVLYSGIRGTGIPAGARVMSVDSATQVTIDINATASGAQSLTFENDQAGIYTSSGDATHPNTAGHNLDALWMARELKTLILTEFA